MFSKDERYYWLLLGLLPGVGSVAARRLVASAGSAKKLFQLNDNELSTMGFSHELCAAKNDLLYERGSLGKRLKTCMAFLEQESCGYISYSQEEYPAILKQINGAHIGLFYRGDYKVLMQPQIAIVGSRQCSTYGKDIAQNWAQKCAAHFCVTSGMAMGIDSAAHIGALKTGSTIAVLAHGLEQVYPKRNTKLAQQISEQGCLVSEFYPGVSPIPDHFPRRNRIISGLAKGVLVVEAAVGSGSLITAKYASEQGREVFAVPGNITAHKASGCHALIREGAELVTSAEELMQSLKVFSGQCILPFDDVAVTQPHASVSLNEKEQAIWECLQHGSLSFSALHGQLKNKAKPVIADVAQLKAELVSMELMGLLACENAQYCLLQQS